MHLEVPISFLLSSSAKQLVVKPRQKSDFSLALVLPTCVVLGIDCQIKNKCLYLAYIFSGIMVYFVNVVFSLGDYFLGFKLTGI